MAVANISICDICTNTFNDGDRQSVVLPCGHNYCLTCLANLEAKNVDNCPSCRKNWKELDLQKFPGIASVKIVLKTEVEQEDALWKKTRKVDYRCTKHKLSFDFWVKDEKIYFCKRCAAENRNICFELIEDVIPDIKTDISCDVHTVGTKIKNDLETLENEKLQLLMLKVNALKFVKLINSLAENIEAQVEQIDASMLKANADLDITKQVEKTIDSVTSEADINIIMESKETLQQLMKTSRISVDNFMTSLLNGILGNCMVAESEDTGWDSTDHSLDEALKGGVSMFNNICAGTILALVGDSNKLQLLVQNDEQYVPSETSNCTTIKVHFKDSFLKPIDVQRDHMRLKMITADKRLCLTEFYGYLDATGIAELPKTIRVLGLAIGSSADSIALNNLRIWPNLECLKVSVDNKILLHGLKPLPDTHGKDIGIPYLTDDLVDNVMPAINALVPKQRFEWIVFPKCRLTTAGVRRLQKQIQGILQTTGVIIEFNDELMPDEKTQADIKEDFLRNLGYNVFFDLNGSILRNTF